MSDVTDLREALEPAQIARSLTKAQRDALRNLGIKSGWQRAPHDGWRRAGQACTALCGKGLCERQNGSPAPIYRLTPTGLAVRDWLKENDQ